MDSKSQSMDEVGEIAWEDVALGRVVADPRPFGDVVLVRKDLPASYHLAVTIDDAVDEVSLVTRGEDLLEATHIHRVLQELLGLPVLIVLSKAYIEFSTMPSQVSPRVFVSARTTDPGAA